MAIFDAGPVGDAAAPEKLARLSAEIASAKATREALKSLRVALEHANGDRFAEACTAAEEALTHDPNLVLGWHLLGIARDKLNQRAVETPDPLAEPVETSAADPSSSRRAPGSPVELRRRFVAYAPGADVVHDVHGAGWVWGSGLGRVTVRFETAQTGPGPVRTFAVDDPALRPAED